MNIDGDDEGGANYKKGPKRPQAGGQRRPAAARDYRVGKGKPPIEHQFKKGQPSPNRRGRPKGSTKANNLQRLLGKIVMANSPDGRRVRKSLGDVIDHKLVELAAKGDLKAIKLIKDIELRYRSLGLIDQPTAEEMKRQQAEEEEKRVLAEKISRRMIEMLEFTAYLKKLQVLRFVNGQPVAEKWVVEAAAERRAADREAKGLGGSANWPRKASQSPKG